MKYYFKFLKTFSGAGRANRREFWLAMIPHIIISTLLGAIFMAASESAGHIVSVIYSLATLVQGITLQIRRLHDTDRSGWCFFLLLLPILGWIIIFCFNCFRGSDSANRYGEPSSA